MKTMFKTLIVAVALSSLLIGSYVIHEVKSDCVVVLANTADQTFDEALMNGLLSIYNCETKCTYGIVKIDVDGEEITARVSIKKLQLFASGKISYADLVRNYVSFG